MSLTNAEVPEDLKHGVETWLKYDKNEQTRDEIVKLINAKSWAELRSRLNFRITFGTAGLRSRMEAGFNRMNTLTVLQASQGLAKYLASSFPHNLSVVVGHDHRFNSKDFAEVTIVAFLQLGFKVYDLGFTEDPSQDVVVHTPMVPFGIDHLHTSGGIMITASHNPKMDNGYKVYYSNGCQIIPPHDQRISQSILANLEPWERSWDWAAVRAEAVQSGMLVDAKKLLVDQYVGTVRRGLVNANVNRTGAPWFVYTPLHGVGFGIFEKILREAWRLEEGSDYLCVEEQRKPDPNFPTVSFPNPEEKGALNKAIELAEKHHISFVLGNDPDADRFSAAAKHNGQWRQLTGNEIGFLFAQHNWELYKLKNEQFKDTNPLAMINSTVSSQMIKKMAEVEGFFYEDTLTGFKWLGNRARELEKSGCYVPFAYEEAIGFMFSNVVHDKDGISAAVVFLQMLWSWKAQALSPFEVLQRAYQKYGVFKEYNGYYTVPNLSLTDKVFSGIRSSYNLQPTHIGHEFRVESYTDLTTGYQSNTPDNEPRLPVDHSSQMITATLMPTATTGQQGFSESVRFTARGSGTEPKLKVYIEAVSSSEELASALAKKAWDVLRREWFKPEQTGLATNF
ncbi:LAQU0S03e02278g1_1 [Lachancea quebecensis]|uniref:phosphopentomutase n=1 Tax=Lachancea quebecensis TaxID=1654605 RepID=A0A0P1KWW0_9SACH|nr:LAQU0S03e02278g1_1 [Lachancea quebecensis]